MELKGKIKVIGETEVNVNYKKRAGERIFNNLIF